jgi:hypothetical protein
MKRLATEVEHEVRRLAAKGHALREIRRMLGCCACHEPVPTLRDHCEQRELAPRADVAHTDETDHGCDRPGLVSYVAVDGLSRAARPITNREAPAPEPHSQWLQ